MTWSDEPPTEDGWYYVKHPCGVVYTSELTDEHWDGGFRTPERGFEFVPRIPTPDELEAERRTHNEALTMIIELRRELERVREQLAEIHNAWGMNLDH